MDSGSVLDTFGKEKRHLHLPGFEPQCLDILVCSLVTIPTELYQLLAFSKSGEVCDQPTPILFHFLSASV